MNPHDVSLDLLHRYNVPGPRYTSYPTAPVWTEDFRPADYERFTGSRVKLTTQQPVNGNRHFEGRLESFKQGRLTLDLSAARKKRRPDQTAAEKLEIDLANVEKANLVPEI